MHTIEQNLERIANALEAMLKFQPAGPKEPSPVQPAVTEGAHNSDNTGSPAIGTPPKELSMPEAQAVVEQQVEVVASASPADDVTVYDGAAIKDEFATLVRAKKISSKAVSDWNEKLGAVGIKQMNQEQLALTYKWLLELKAA